MEKIDLSNDAKAIAAAAAINDAVGMIKEGMKKGMAETMPLEISKSFAKEEDHQEILRLRVKILANLIS